MYVASVGIDPGATGALSVVYTKDNVPHSFYTIEFKHSGIDGYINTLKDILAKYPIKKVLVEKVHAMPGQGVTSMFSFGQRYGELLGMLKTLGLGYELVTPQMWMKEIGCLAPKSTKAERKKAISEKIIAMYPDTGDLIRGPKSGYKDGVADAFGLAHYAYKKYK